MIFIPVGSCSQRWHQCRVGQQAAMGHWGQHPPSPSSVILMPWQPKAAAHYQATFPSPASRTQSCQPLPCPCCNANGAALEPCRAGGGAQAAGWRGQAQVPGHVMCSPSQSQWFSLSWACPLQRVQQWLGKGGAGDPAPAGELRVCCSPPAAGCPWEKKHSSRNKILTMPLMWWHRSILPTNNWLYILLLTLLLERIIELYCLWHLYSCSTDQLLWGKAGWSIGWLVIT